MHVSVSSTRHAASVDRDDLMVTPVEDPEGSTGPDASTTGESPADGERTSDHTKNRWPIVIGLALLTIAADQASKSWAVSSLVYGRPVDVVPPLRFNLAFNTGMAFSRGTNSGALIGVVAIGIVVVMLFLARRSSSRVQLIAMGVIIGGALGNVIDRLFRAGTAMSGGGFMSGAVVDFIDVQFWPIFNIADMAVVIGGLVLAISMIWVEDDHPADES